MESTAVNQPMTGRDRVFNTIQGKPCDRRAYSAVLGLYGAKLIGAPLEQYYTDPDLFVKGQEAVVELFNPDMMLSPLYMCNFATAFGSKIKFFDHQPPNLYRPVITSRDKFDTIKFPDINTNDSLRYTRSIVQQLKEKFGATKAIGAITMSPMEIPVMIFSLDNWMEIIIDRDHDTIEKIMKKIIPFFVEFSNTLFDDGADCLIMPTAFTTPTIVTNAILHQICLPILKEAFAQLKGPVVMHHVGGPYLPYLKDLTEIPNVLGFVVDSTDNLDEARAAIGDNYLLIGNVRVPQIEKMKPLAIDLAIKKILENRKDDPRFFLTSSGPDIPLATPIESILAFRKAAEKWG